MSDVEAARQRVIETLKLNDATASEELQDLVLLASQLCDTPMAAFTVLGPLRQWLKAKVGIAANSTERELAFCNVTVQGSEVLEVGDALADPRFCEHPFVVEDPHLRFYAGVPVGLPGEPPIGALCVLDTKPRALTADQRRSLAALGRGATRHLQLRRMMSSEREAHVQVQHQLEHADRLAVVGQLAAALAHELGTPLAIVAGRARLLTGQVAPAAVEQNARVIVEQSDRMAHFIRQLLDFARQRQPRKAAYDLRVVVRQAVSLLAPMAKTRGVALEWSEPPEALVVNVDASQIGQVLTNLVVNALHATPRGGSITFAARGEPASVRLSVQDTGSGIAADDLPRLFEPFFTTKETGEGTGLGLSIAAKVVRDHGGHLDVESEPGHGACFTIHLPR
jgi:signal transduction histidine kinase